MLTMKKGANETVEVTIKGLFEGKSGSLTYAKSCMKTPSFLTWIQLLNSMAISIKTATYGDGAFFAKGMDLDALIEKIKHSILTGTSMPDLVETLPTPASSSQHVNVAIMFISN